MSASDPTIRAEVARTAAKEAGERIAVANESNHLLDRGRPPIARAAEQVRADAARIAREEGAR